MRRVTVSMRISRIIAIMFIWASLIAGACTSSKQATIPKAPPMETLVVIMAEPEQRAAGFNYEGEFRPHTIKVSVGATVTWNNTDNKVHSVISDDGFFSKRLEYGESYNYTFTQTGVFAYHDELYDGMDGLVYVE